MSCPECHHPNPDTAHCCEACGTRLVLICRVCCQSASLRAKVCSACGASLGASAPASSGLPVQTVEERNSQYAEAERRHLTVMFCDLVGSTALSEQLDPEELRDIVQAYQDACAQVISRFEGYIAQYLGDGLLVYFGYPTAHEDDAARAIRAGLAIIDAIQIAAIHPQHETQPIQVRIGIHTGQVVVGEVGGGSRREQLALGETPNIASRIQGLAAPNTLMISAASYRLVQGQFACEARGTQTAKGISAPIELYQVLGPGKTQSRFELAVKMGLTPLVGRREEMAQLDHCWQLAKAGNGQIVLLSGEPGIGKSRLVQELKQRVKQDGVSQLFVPSGRQVEYRCAPQYQNSTFYPIIELLTRVLQFGPDDTPADKLAKLERALHSSALPVQEYAPLLAALLSVPMLEMVLTFRPEFQPPWPVSDTMTWLSLSRLAPEQTQQMVVQVARNTTLPPDVFQQVVDKTDGVPLFVEELTKMVIESGLMREAGDSQGGATPLPALAIPVTLQDSLMARLDQLAPVREIAELGATLGREFSYALIQAITPVDEATLQHGLSLLVDKELVQQKGVPPHARYVFKHALIRDAAYASLLRSKRQQVHRQIAHVLESRFSEIVTDQPETLAHHSTEAGLISQALPYWRQAGLRAGQRSANVEAVHHLSKGLELLQTLEDTPERAAHELRLCLALGGPLIATSGYAAPDVERVFRRSQELCQQLGETPQLFPALWGLFGFFLVRAELSTAQQLATQMLQLAERTQKPDLLLEGHFVQGQVDFHLGEMTLARDHLHDSVRRYMSQPQPADPSRTVQDTGVAALSYFASALWLLGYPDQALARASEAVEVAQDLKHPLSLVWALSQPSQAETYIAEFKHDLSTWQALGSALGQSNYLALLAEMHEQAGQAEAGLGVLETALKETRRTGERWYAAELYRLRGEMLLVQEIKSQRSKVKGQRSKVKSGRRRKHVFGRRL